MRRRQSACWRCMKAQAHKFQYTLCVSVPWSSSSRSSDTHQSYITPDALTGMSSRLAGSLGPSRRSRRSEEMVLRQSTSSAWRREPPYLPRGLICNMSWPKRRCYAPLSHDSPPVCNEEGDGLPQRPRARPICQYIPKDFGESRPMKP